MKHLRAIHRATGITIAVFFIFHIVNHLFALGGAAWHIRVMNVFRVVYRFPPVEFVLLLAVLTQWLTGLSLLWKKGFRKNLFDVLHAVSGLYLSFFFLIHIGAVMMGRYSWHVETDFHFAASGVKNSPSNYFFLPYYSLSVLSVFVHIACVHRQKMLTKNQDNHLQRSVQSPFVIIGAGVVITTLIMFGLAYG
jgi:succinate dehydrogenase/fumarate reductase cytochrome b subunit